ncbi:MAG TPA: chromosome partitioning protein ParA, partial [Alistipes obesi]|nr:chromosome partitioning protein ParA [Alistipes communis]
MKFDLNSLNLPDCKPFLRMAKIIALANQKGGVG